MGSRKKEAQWYDRRRTFLGLPLSFTKYYLFAEKLIVETGAFNLREEEIRLYRIMDVTLRRSFGQRLFGLGTIHICSADKTTPELDIKSIKNAGKTKELLSELVENARTAKNITGREFMGADDNDFNFDHR